MKKQFLQLFNNRHIALLWRYGIVGIIASIIHFCVAYVFYEWIHVRFLMAHFLGFLCGLIVAYLGHYFYSFRDNAAHSRRFPKFLITTSAALLLHQFGAQIMVKYLLLDYSTQVLPLLVISVPIITFLLNKFWVFSSIDK